MDIKIQRNHKIPHMITKLKILPSYVMDFNVRIATITLTNKRRGCFYVFENEFKSCNNTFQSLHKL